jgi:sigma-B regulation protein RsbU (phosphoserine phosphatase)
MRPGVSALVMEELKRLGAVSALGQVGTPPEERFDRITTLARSVFGVALARIVLVGRDELFLKSSQPFGASAYLPRQGSLCSLAVEQQEMLVVTDADDDPRVSAEYRVPGIEHLRFYVGRPLRVDNGHVVGVLCLIDSRPRSFGVEERAVLERMALLVEHELVRDAESFPEASVPGDPVRAPDTVALPG